MSVHLDELCGKVIRTNFYRILTDIHCFVLYLAEAAYF